MISKQLKRKSHTIENILRITSNDGRNETDIDKMDHKHKDEK